MCSTRFNLRDRFPSQRSICHRLRNKPKHNPISLLSTQHKSTFHGYQISILKTNQANLCRLNLLNLARITNREYLIQTKHPQT